MKRRFSPLFPRISALLVGNNSAWAQIDPNQLKALVVQNIMNRIEGVREMRASGSPKHGSRWVGGCILRRYVEIILWRLVS